MDRQTEFPLVHSAPSVEGRVKTIKRSLIGSRRCFMLTLMLMLMLCYYIERTTGALWRQSEVFLIEVSAFWARLALQLPNIHRLGATF